MNFDNLMQGDFIHLYVIPWGIRIVTALLILVIGRMLAKFAVKAFRRVMHRMKMDQMLINFLANILYTLLLVVVVMASLEQLGVKTTSALAILGAAGLAIGLSLQSSLSNFASGVMLIIFRPFKVGDFVEAGGTSGVVEEITVFSTRMRTGDNREVIVPNGKIYGDTIVNYSARDTRRIDMVFGISYDDNIKQAKDIMSKIMDDHELILKDPAPVILISELADSSINFTVRPWVKSGDYWGVRSELLQTIKEAFDENGISVPYPQRDIHVYNSDAA